MSPRNERHAFLRRLVDERIVESQADLLLALAAAGLDVHQSTLSRDLRELGIRKVQGRYRREVSSAPRLHLTASDGKARGALDISRTAGSSGTTLPEVHGFTACGPNLITVRTGTGQAQLLGVLLDTSGDASVVGTIAGDDTVLVVTKGRPQQRVAEALLASWFGEDKRDAV
jgi:transcriptional regulator of arginine metabolism